MSSGNPGFTGSILDHVDLIVVINLLSRAHPDLLNFCRQYPPTPMNAGFGNLGIHYGEALVGLAWYLSCYIGYLYRNNPTGNQSIQIRSGIRHLLMMFLSYVSICCHETASYSNYTHPPLINGPPTRTPAAPMNPNAPGFQPQSCGYPPYGCMPVPVAPIPVPANVAGPAPWNGGQWSMPHPPAAAPVPRPVIPGSQPPVFRGPQNNNKNLNQRQERPNGAVRRRQSRGRPPCPWQGRSQLREPIEMDSLSPIPTPAPISPQGPAARILTNAEAEAEFYKAMANMNIGTNQQNNGSRTPTAPPAANQPGNNAPAANMADQQQQGPANRTGQQQPAVQSRGTSTLPTPIHPPHFYQY